jgi:hypothetical protein
MKTVYKHNKDNAPLEQDAIAVAAISAWVKGTATQVQIDYLWSKLDKYVACLFEGLKADFLSTLLLEQDLISIGGFFMLLNKRINKYKSNRASIRNFVYWIFKSYLYQARIKYAREHKRKSCYRDFMALLQTKRLVVKNHSDYIRFDDEPIKQEKQTNKKKRKMSRIKMAYFNGNKEIED